MEMNSRPRRAALHQRSDSETNEVRTNPSIHSSNSSVSQKASDVSAWVPHPVAASISRDSTRSSSHTTSTNSSRGPSGSIDSLPPVPPLKIYKRESTFIIPRDPPIITTRKSENPDILVCPTPSPNTIPPKAQTFPKSILKKPSRPALPPYTVEEYNEKSNSWGEGSVQSPTNSEVSRMNSHTIRIVENSEDSNDEGSEDGDVLGGLVNRQHSVSISPRVTPSPRLGESSAQSVRIVPPQPAPVRSRSNASTERPGTAGSLLASAKQLPAWARYFYSKKGGRGSIIIEPEIPRYGNEDSTERTVKHQQSDDSMQITEVIPPGTLYQGQRQCGSSESVPGVDWVGSRTKIMDAEIATQWSTPHLDHTPLSRFETIDRQLVLFCLGFLLPMCWIIAAFLPLPEVHRHSFKQPVSGVDQPSNYIVDVEVGSNNTVRQQRKYENSKWWRSVNRTMSVVGLLVIGAIIALCVLAATSGV